VDIPDHHVHSEWSWDAHRGSMRESCRRAVELGLPSLAFTEHADWVRGPAFVVDVTGYLESLERCRSEFPSLRIMSGVELGEPHRFPEPAAALLSTGAFERVLGSVHVIESEQGLTDASDPGFLTAGNCDRLFRGFLADTLRLVESSARFDVLAHLDYPRRYWPDRDAYNAETFEAELREVLRALARRGAALEVNTTRGTVLCPAPDVIRWWREEGGERVTFGSDAHSPDLLVAGFELAAEAVEAAGFRPQDDPNLPWLRS
jgi:histidinol-phosphatase (PHP family)